LNRANTLALYPLFLDVITTKSRSRIRKQRGAADQRFRQLQLNSYFSYRFLFFDQDAGDPEIGAGRWDVERAGIVVRDLQSREPGSIADLMTFIVGLPALTPLLSAFSRARGRRPSSGGGEARGRAPAQLPGRC
jgi:hypothetical protein